MNEFEGDVRLVSGDDGADIAVSNGLVEPCADSGTAAFLSLFGGNDGDADGRGRGAWWGNGVSGTAVAERVKSGFLAEISGKSVTGAMISRARKAAEDDLKWMVDEGIADSVSVSVVAEARNRLGVTVDARKGGGTVFLAEFGARTGGD